MKTIQSVQGYAWPPSLFNLPRGNRLRARLNVIMIPLKMAERFSITCDPCDHAIAIDMYKNLVDIRFIHKFSRQVSALFYQIYFN